MPVANSRYPVKRKPVRSFVRRSGRITPAQQRALERLLPRYQVPADCTDLRAVFNAQAPLVVEIGFGNGEALARMATREPTRNFIGIDVHEPGIGRLLMMLDENGIANVRVAIGDAVDVLGEQCVSASIDGFRIFFPDPWPKKRHHKRRLIQPGFVALLADRLTPGGFLHLATDWRPYADWMIQVLADEPAFENIGDPFVPRPGWRPRTRFERRGEIRGHEIYDLLYRRRNI